MAAEKYLIGIDVGTTSLKVAVIDEEANLLGVASGKYRFITPDQKSVQIDTGSLWDAVVRCLSMLSTSKGIDLAKTAGISISSLCPGLVALGENGEVLVEPIIYSDRRSVHEAEIILDRVGRERLFEITANSSMAGAFSGSSMLWIKNNLPEQYEKTKYFGHLNTFLANRMTGAFAIDYSNASYTNLFETAGGKKWSDELCDSIEIAREKLPELHDSTDVVGGLSNKDLIRLGIPEGTPVAIGGADTPCATLAAGVTRAGDVCESVGTTNVLTVCIDRPVFDRGFINRCHVVPGTWIYQGAMSFTGAANEWFLREFCDDLIQNSVSLGEAYEKANQEAAAAAPGCDGVVFLPYMQGERSPIWDAYARGVFFGASLRTTRKEMNRAVLEACGYGLRQLADTAEAVTGNRISSWSAIGGGAKSEIWTQIKADITGRDIKILDLSEMASVGAALLGGVGAGVFKDVFEASDKVDKKVVKTIKSNHENDGIYAKRFEVYKQLYPALKDIYKLNANNI
ncbi:MAG: FGGY family carbohydrate kinase [Lachnospiraceae bacterium]|nr:FGGY family carbohydrate kinase [Lachnospiraceae bacterium]